MHYAYAIALNLQFDKKWLTIGQADARIIMDTATFDHREPFREIESKSLNKELVDEGPS